MDEQSTASATSGTKSDASASDASRFVIPDEVQSDYPDLVELIQKTESMNDDERNYWFQTLLIMTDEQVQNLRQILTTERDNLAAIDQKAQEEMNQINSRQIREWKEFELKEKKESIKQAEQKSLQKDIGEQEALLDELENL